MKELIRKPKGRSWIFLGMLLTGFLIGVSGCGTKDTTAEPAPSAQQSTVTAQDNQGQAAERRAANPAIEAAMSIRRLQASQEMVLTSDQKDKLKPILQSLIDTTDPDQTFLQEKADAITAVLTDEQKTYLSTNSPKGNQNGKGQNEEGEPKGQPGVQPGVQPDGQGGSPNKQAGGSPQSQDIFKQVLDSLT